MIKQIISILIILLMVNSVTVANDYGNLQFNYNGGKKITILQKEVQIDPDVFDAKGFLTVPQKLAQKQEAAELKKDEIIAELFKENAELRAIIRQMLGEVDNTPVDEQQPADNAGGLAAQVLPIFTAKCGKCHTEDSVNGGPTILTKDKKLAPLTAAEADIIYESVFGAPYLEEFGIKKMPLGGEPLSDAEIEIVKKWKLELAIREREKQ